MEETNTNIPDYESLSDDKGDKHDEDKDDEATDPTYSTNLTEGSSKPGQKRKGTRKRRSKAWDTFDELPIGEDKVFTLSPSTPSCLLDILMAADKDDVSTGIFFAEFMKNVKLVKTGALYFCFMYP
ncbi:hypothetical protein AgCh_020751 [Apium graveolens]